MKTRSLAFRLVGATWLAFTCLTAAASVTTLFDPGLGTTPSAQGWVTTVAGGPYSASIDPSGAYTFDTTQDIAMSAGSAKFFQPLLKTANGFILDFNLKVLAESHVDDDRAGFSVLFNGLNPKHGLELAFRADQIWAYDADFTHGTAVAFDTTVQVDYQLVVQNDHYSLFGNGQALLDGALVDYDDFASIVYAVPGLLFFGDDTSRAGAKVQVGKISLGPVAAQAVPEPGSSSLLAAGLAALLMAERLHRKRG